LFRNFGRLVNEEGITAASERLRAEERRWELQKADIVMEVVRSFETILRLQKQIDCDKAILERTDKLRELTRIRERQGRASPVDTLRIDLLYGQAQSRQETHTEELFSASRELAELLGFPPEQSIELTTTPLPDLEVPPMEAAIQASLSNRLDYAQSLDDYRSLQRQVKLARRKLEPDLTLVAANQYYDQDNRFSDSTDLNNSLWTVGLAGQMDLLQHRNKTSVSTAKVDVQSAWEAICIKRRTLAREVQQAVSAYRQVRAEFTIAGRNYEAAQSRAELARRLFEMGRGDNFAVSDAENAFVEAESTLLSTRARICIAGYNLFRIMGILTEAPLSLKPNPL
jgi:outer membrane protein TolC